MCVPLRDSTPGSLTQHAPSSCTPALLLRPPAHPRAVSALRFSARDRTFLGHSGTRRAGWVTLIVGVLITDGLLWWRVSQSYSDSRIRHVGVGIGEPRTCPPGQVPKLRCTRRIQTSSSPLRLTLIQTGDSLFVGVLIAVDTRGGVNRRRIQAESDVIRRAGMGRGAGTSKHMPSDESLRWRLSQSYSFRRILTLGSQDSSEALVHMGLAAQFYPLPPPSPGSLDPWKASE